jgi:hypothetical protein
MGKKSITPPDVRDGVRRLDDALNRLVLSAIDADGARRWWRLRARSRPFPWPTWPASRRASFVNCAGRRRRGIGLQLVLNSSRASPVHQLVLLVWPTSPTTR